MSLAPGTAKVLPFPARFAPAAPIPTDQTNSAPIALELGHRGQWCGILYVARQLRLEAVDLRTVVAHIRAHIAASGFPSPASSRLRHGQPVTGAAAVTPKSEWLRAAVDAWVATRTFNDGTSGGSLSGHSADRAAQIDAALAQRFAQGTRA